MTTDFYVAVQYIIFLVLLISLSIFWFSEELFIGILAVSGFFFLSLDRELLLCREIGRCEKKSLKPILFEICSPIKRKRPAAEFCVKDEIFGKFYKKSLLKSNISK